MAVVARLEDGVKHFCSLFVVGVDARQRLLHPEGHIVTDKQRHPFEGRVNETAIFNRQRVNLIFMKMRIPPVMAVDTYHQDSGHHVACESAHGLHLVIAVVATVHHAASVTMPAGDARRAFVHEVVVLVDQRLELFLVEDDSPVAHLAVNHAVVVVFRW